MSSIAQSFLSEHSFASCAILSLTLLIPTTLSDCEEEPDCPSCVADFAIYDPSYEDDGVWEEEVVALQAMFDLYGWSYESLGPQDINGGRLGSGDSRRYRALIAPGGYAYRRNQDTNATGEEDIREFIRTGGNYVGFCAGTFWAAESVVWAETASGDGGAYNQESDYGATPYDLHLFDGAAQGPFGWTPWNNGTNASLEAAFIDTSVPTMQTIGMPETTRFFYYGGPFYLPEVELEGYEVWARAIAPAGLPAGATTGDGEPTIIRYKYDEGDVVLFSYHPEILIDSMADNVELSTYIIEDEVIWDTGEQAQEEVNFYSWNIVHAALQIAANESVTPLESIP